MGGAASLIESNDMDQSYGRMSPDMRCMAGNTPTTSTKHINLHKVDHTNQRKYDIKQNDALLCVTRQMNANPLAFELLAGDEKTKLVRCWKKPARKTWFIQSYVSPAYRGQKPCVNDVVVNEAGEYHDGDESGKTPVYRTYELEWNHANRSAKVYPIIKDESDKTGKVGSPVYKVERIRGCAERYQVVHLTSAEYSSTSSANHPLVSHWHWENDTIDLVVAQGSDLALHFVLAVICNIMKQSENVTFLALCNGMCCVSDKFKAE